jgi:peptidyl-tRNA hydrolase, PTH1 family
MALFTRQPQASDSIQLYTLGQNKTVLLVGLGNVGKQYDGTRHNIGFLCIDNFVSKMEEMEPWIEKRDLKCYLSKGRIGGSQVIAIKPTTFMNLSGQAVQAAANFYKVGTEYITVIHDELDIDFGQIRLRVGGASAGHNGVKSITEVLGESYGRIRIGIGPKEPAQIDSADFVLQKFTAEQEKQLPNLLQEVNAVTSEYIYGGQLPHETHNFLV